MQLEIRVVSGPEEIVGRTGLLFPTLSTGGVLIRPFGRLDIYSMFGDFEGIEAISRTHLLMTFDSEGARVEVRDPGSMNGTFPSKCVVEKGAQKIELAGLITIELAITEKGSGTFLPTSESKEEWMKYITDSVESFSDSVGWEYVIRLSWNSIGKPEKDLTVEDFEWKISPSQEEIRKRGWGKEESWFSQNGGFVQEEGHEDGLFYVLSMSSAMASFAVEHSNDRTLPGEGDVAQWISTMSLIPFEIISKGPKDKLYGQWTKGSLEQYIAHICSKFDWNHYRNN